MNELGKYISKIRQERNLTQKELADRMHLHVTTISKWENGNSVPNLSYFEMLAKALDITTTELFECRKNGTENEPENTSDCKESAVSDNAACCDNAAICENTASCDNAASCDDIASLDNAASCDNATSCDDIASLDNTTSCDNIAGHGRTAKYVKKILPILIAVILFAATIAGIAVYKANSNELKYKIVDEYLSEDADYFGFNSIYNIVVEYDGTMTDEFLQAYQHEIRDKYKDHFQTSDLLRVFFVNQYDHERSTAEANYELFILPLSQ